MSVKTIIYHLQKPVDIAFLTFFRMAFGLSMLWELWRYIDKGWVNSHWIAPSFYFKYFGFEWVTPWPGNGMHIHFLVLSVAALLIMLGLWYRYATVVFFLGFTYIFLLDQARYLNHFYLICLFSFLLIFLPAHRASSLDSHWQPELKTTVTPTWVLWLLRFQMGIVYIYGGIAKLNADWLRGEPMRMWLSSRTDFPFFGQFFTQEWMVYGFSYGGLLLDLFVVPFLLWRRTRWAAFITIAIFHITNARLFSIGVFPWLALAATTVFLPPDWPKRLFNSAESIPTVQKEPQKSHPLLWGLLIAYVALQLLLPVRHWVYPSYAHWSEEGHRFAWRMKLRDKRGDIAFFVIDPETNDSVMIDPDDYLTSTQHRKMRSTPDMILQFAHFLGEEWAKDGVSAEVYVNSSISLNGHNPQPLVDGAIDLAAQPRTLGNSSWILPFRSNYSVE